jgi:hypothetical protein
MPMDAPNTDSGLGYFQKLWPDVFSDDRNPREAKPLVEERLNTLLSAVNPPRDEDSLLPESTYQGYRDPDELEETGEPNRLQLFLRAYDDDTPTVENQEITEFCGDMHPSILGQHGKCQRRAAWLDDRLHSFYSIPQPHSGPVHHAHASASGPVHSIANSSTQIPGGKARGSNTGNEASGSNGQVPSAMLPYRQYGPPLSASSLHGHLMKEVRQF